MDKKADKDEDRMPSEATTTQLREHPVTPEFLEEVYKVRQQVTRDSSGKLFEDSAKLIDEMRDERTRQLMQAISGQYEYDEELDGEQC